MLQKARALSLVVLPDSSLGWADSDGAIVEALNPATVAGLAEKHDLCVTGPVWHGLIRV